MFDTKFSIYYQGFKNHLGILIFDKNSEYLNCIQKSGQS